MHIVDRLRADQLIKEIQRMEIRDARAARGDPRQKTKSNRRRTRTPSGRARSRGAAKETLCIPIAWRLIASSSTSAPDRSRGYITPGLTPVRPGVFFGILEPFAMPAVAPALLPLCADAPPSGRHGRRSCRGVAISAPAPAPKRGGNPFNRRLYFQERFTYGGRIMGRSTFGDA